MAPNEDYYTPLVENNFLKVASITFLMISNIVGIPLVYGMIWFERFGSDKKRTILNQLFSATCWIFILHVCCLVHLPEVFRYLHGPLPQCWCFLASVLRNAALTIYVLYYDAITIMR
jgi:hypothetical protein